MTLILFVYGACLGSFLVAMADRYVTGESPFFPPSHCATCSTRLVPWQMVPILSYLVLRGRCAYCQANIMPTTLFVEGVTAILLTTWTPTFTLPLLWLSLWTFAALCDTQTQTFPGWLSWAALGISLISQPWSIILLATSLFGLIRWLWPHWIHPWIGDGDLEMMLGYWLLFGSLSLVHWVLLACGLALLTVRAHVKFAFLPYLMASALAWWLWP
ncbi:prepilin peptidase [Levilactobacillus tongjiangensis]|uniref:Prepilin peptidase n=1 Tax=Levilactobacillus tongjiangensis TaxID=2486023 RepID=A0ABW1STI2_9LACO|nr:A24 family peptidase [Levilactobacillus tongjiangensis]